MESKRKVRKPKQNRAVNSKEKIVEAAYKLFCEKGYYKTNSIEISKKAGVSVGCFYSYFKDKDAVFFEILEAFNNEFFKITDEAQDMFHIYKKDKKEWIALIIDKLIKIHEDFKDFIKELSVLYNSNAEIRAIMDKHYEKVRELIFNFLKFYEADIKVSDIEAAIVIVFAMIEAIVHTIVFKKNTIDSNRILQSGIEAVEKYLFK